LDGELPFVKIADAIAYSLEKTERVKADEYEVLKETDAQARAYAEEFIKRNRIV
jgi:1-deoxy-D-xylulose 5-phosphate reductoisomerase